MLLRVIWSNFECILHHAHAFKEIRKYILQCSFSSSTPLVHRRVHMLYYQWFHHSMHYSILLKNKFHSEMRVLCAVLKHSNRQYSFIHEHHHQFSWGFPGDPFLSFSVWNRCNDHFRLYIFTFSNSFIYVSFTLLREYCLYNSDFLIFPLFLVQH